MITREQLRAARALLHIEQAELARRAQVSVVTIRRIEAADVVTRVAPAKLEAVRRALEEAGIEFIPNGVARRANGAEQAALFRDLQAISIRSAARLQGRNVTTEADLYNEDGLPA
jgi:transcriptional regulator with XRE-family HTH domain